MREHRGLRRAGRAGGEQQDREIGRSLRARRTRRRRSADRRERRRRRPPEFPVAAIRRKIRRNGRGWATARRARSAFAARRERRARARPRRARAASSCDGEPTLSGTATAPAAERPEVRGDECGLVAGDDRRPGRRAAARRATVRRDRGRPAASCAVGDAARARRARRDRARTRRSRAAPRRGSRCGRLRERDARSRTSTGEATPRGAVERGEPAAAERTRSRPQLRTFLGRAGRLRCVVTRVAPSGHTPTPATGTPISCEAAGSRRVAGRASLPSVPGPPSLYAK